MPERFYVIETRGYSIGSLGRTSGTQTEQSSLAVLDRRCGQREVASFTAKAGQADWHRRVKAEARCAELNAWAMGHR